MLQLWMSWRWGRENGFDFGSLLFASLMELGGI